MTNRMVARWQRSTAQILKTLEIRLPQPTALTRRTNYPYHCLAQELVLPKKVNNEDTTEKISAEKKKKTSQRKLFKPKLWIKK